MLGSRHATPLAQRRRRRMPILPGCDDRRCRGGGGGGGRSPAWPVPAQAQPGALPVVAGPQCSGATVYSPAPGDGL